MTKTKDFFWRASALNFVAELKQQGHRDALALPRYTFGPRDCFNLPWFWRVSWQEIPLNPK